MNYEQILQIQRDILAGKYRAPDCSLPKSPTYTRATRKRKVEDREWDEEAFVDNFYNDDFGEHGDVGDNEERDVAPDYFKECDLLVTSFCPGRYINNTVAGEALYQGSLYTGKDLARFLLAFKARHLTVGDGLLANVIGMMATFMPSSNILKHCLPKKPSTYFLLKAIDNLACYKSDLRTLAIDCCRKRCMAFYSDSKNLNFCRQCGHSRWKLCYAECYDEATNEKICQHIQRPFIQLYYNVVQDRIVKLLKSDLKNLFDYEEHRAGKVQLVL